LAKYIPEKCLQKESIYALILKIKDQGNVS